MPLEGSGRARAIMWEAFRSSCLIPHLPRSDCCQGACACWERRGMLPRTKVTRLNSIRLCGLPLWCLCADVTCLPRVSAAQLAHVRDKFRAPPGAAPQPWRRARKGWGAGPTQTLTLLVRRSTPLGPHFSGHRSPGQGGEGRKTLLREARCACGQW